VDVHYPMYGVPPHDRMMTVACGVSVLFALFYASVVARREKSPWPYFVVLGAGLSVIYEPIGDLLGHVAYAEQGQITWIETFGRRIPMLIGFVYFFYFSVPVIWLNTRLEKGLSFSRWCSWYAITTVLTGLFEAPFLNVGTWVYYGDNQPLKFLGYPFWWGFANGSMLFVLAAAVRLLRRSLLTGRSSFWLTPLYPSILASAHMGPSMLVVSAINSTESLTIVNLAAAASSLLYVLNTLVLGRLVTHRAAAAERHAASGVAAIS
jgi:hypothetical protein